VRGDLDLVERHGRLTAQLMRLFGLNFNLAPVIEVSLDDHADNALGGRCYGQSPEQVIAYAQVYLKALHAEGVLACGKHFPGYTGASVDAHHSLPVTDRSRAEMDRVELEPFRRLGDQLDAVMTGHIWYRSLEPKELPATFSKVMLQGILREEIDYHGLVLSDDLDMGALLERYRSAEVIQRSVEAGHDQLLLCHQIDKLPEAAEALRAVARSDVDRALQAIHTSKSQLCPPTNFSQSAFEALNRSVWDLRVETLGPELAHEQTYVAGKRSPVEEY